MSVQRCHVAAEWTQQVAGLQRPMRETLSRGCRDARADPRPAMLGYKHVHLRQHYHTHEVMDGSHEQMHMHTS